MNTQHITYNRHVPLKIERINDNLEQQAQALFKSWFVDFEPFKDGKFIDSELGLIPEGWRVGVLSDILHITKKSVTPSICPNELYHHYSLPSFDEGERPELQYGIEILSNKFVVSNDTILFSKLNPRIKRIWYIEEAYDNSICSTEFIPYKAKDSNLTYFIYSLINSDSFYQSAMALVNGATGSHQRFHPLSTLNFKIALSKEAAFNFNNILSPIIKKRTKNITEIDVLSKLRDTLLPKLMSGELKINDLNS